MHHYDPREKAGQENQPHHKQDFWVADTGAASGVHGGYS
jgi:hypothetical protein